MRKWAVAVGVIAAGAFALGITNLITSFSGGLVTVLAFIACAAGVGLIVELWYVSRRIERAPNFAKPS